MSATLTRLTVSQARRGLNDASRLSTEQIDELQKIVAAFHNARPPRNKQCVACSAAGMAGMVVGTIDRYG
jgi:hypothetical protein